jgi:dTDP-4-amino-4,6-dideoxygalactose transaminase
MIPIADPQVGERERTLVESVLEEGRLASGEEVATFEERVAEMAGTDMAVATSNGTTALHAALEALGIGSGDRVLTTPMSFVATANAVRLCGATPVFADVGPVTYNLDPDAAAERLESDSIDAILVVHLYGLPAEMDRFRELADEHDAVLVEDAAQAHGARYDGEPVGSFGDAACYSFYATKNATTGEGGAVVSDSEEVVRRTREFVDHGRDGDGHHRRLGHNFRMTNVQAAIGLGQLERLAELTAARRRNAGILNHLITADRVVLPTSPSERRHVYHQYTVRHPERDALKDHLEAAGVGAGVYYPRPIPDEPAYDHVDEEFPAAQRLCEEVVSVPIHPGLSNEDLQTIAGAINEFELARTRP